MAIIINIKIKFECNNCHEIFYIHYQYLIQKTVLSCPNCSQNFPEENLKKLNDGLHLIYEAYNFSSIKENRLQGNPFDFLIEFSYL